MTCLNPNVRKICGNLKNCSLVRSSRSFLAFALLPATEKSWGWGTDGRTDYSSPLLAGSWCMTAETSLVGGEMVKKIVGGRGWGALVPVH